MPRATIEMRGKTSSWSVTWDASKEQIEAMRKDGIEVGIVMNSMPAWIVDAGLIWPWCLFQDLWNFRNPWRA